MASTDSFDQVMSGLEGGDDAAAEAVFHRFAARLVALARQRLTADLRSKEAPEEVVQSVFRSFFTRHRDGQFELLGWDGLWAVLVLIAVRKCVNRVEYYRAACRDVRREVPLSAREEADFVSPLLDREPNPEEVAALADVVEQLARGLDPDDRHILELHLQGYSNPEIVQQTGRAERTVRRTIALVRRRLARLRDETRP